MNKQKLSELKIGDTILVKDEETLFVAANNGVGEASAGAYFEVEGVECFSTDDEFVSWAMVSLYGKECFGNKLFVTIVDESVSFSLVKKPSWFVDGMRSERLEEGGNLFLFEQDPEILDVEELDYANSFELMHNEESMEMSMTGKYSAENGSGQPCSIVSYSSEKKQFFVIETGSRGSGFIEALEGYDINNELELFPA